MFLNFIVAHSGEGGRSFFRRRVTERLSAERAFPSQLILSGLWWLSPRPGRLFPLFNYGSARSCRKTGEKVGINSLIRKQAEVKTGITALWSYASVCRSNTISVHKWLCKINLYVFASYVVTGKEPCHTAPQHQSAKDQCQPNQKLESWNMNVAAKKQTKNAEHFEIWVLPFAKSRYRPTARKLLTHCYLVTVELTFDLWDTKQSIIRHTQLDIQLKSM